MRAYKYLVALVIPLLVKKSLAGPDQSLTDTSTPNFPAVVSPKINDTDMETDSKVNYNFHGSQQIFYVSGPLHGSSSFDNIPRTESYTNISICNFKNIFFDIVLFVKNDCPNGTHDRADSHTPARLTTPLVKLGEKTYYFGIFFKVNWYKASQYCRYHGMHLASIASHEENEKLEKHLKDLNLGDQPFWTSGTDQADEGTFFWMANGRPITYKNWIPGEPNNVRDKNGNGENCLEFWNKEGKGFKWNDRPCSWEIFFICEEQ